MSIEISKEQVRDARKFAGLSTEKAGALVHISGRMWRKYEAGEAPIHLAFWELFLIKTGQVLR
jgi:DNA (cytosine-5)-methyltransferase 1